MTRDTPALRYQRALAAGDIEPDPQQALAVACLDDLYQRLLTARIPRTGLKGLLDRLRGERRTVAVEGVYLWGGVGRGKTWLVDSFYECLPFMEKRRIHFHRFMQRVHADLRELGDMERPLRTVAAGLAREASVICLDEFHVSDITDAMLLSGLLEALHDQGVTMVSTSNIHPDGLYKGGLQRERFLPAIARIKQHNRIFELGAGTDFRLRYLDRAEIYHAALDEHGSRILEAGFAHLAPGADNPAAMIEIAGRSILTVNWGEGVAWFDFAALCDGPRGVADYIELGRLFHTILIANVPVLGEDMTDQARRFVNMIDEFYDRRVKIMITAAAGIDDLYTGRRLAFEFERTRSRLIEMQSHDYLASPHQPD